MFRQTRFGCEGKGVACEGRGWGARRKLFLPSVLLLPVGEFWHHGERLTEELHNYMYVAKQLQPFLTRDFVLQRTGHSMLHCWRKIFLYIGLDRQTHARIMVSLKPEVSIISPVWCSLHLPFPAWKKCCKPFQLNIPSPRDAFSN